MDIIKDKKARSQIEDLGDRVRAVDLFYGEWSLRNESKFLAEIRKLQLAQQEMMKCQSDLWQMVQALASFLKVGLVKEPEAWKVIPLNKPMCPDRRRRAR